MAEIVAHPVGVEGDGIDKTLRLYREFNPCGNLATHLTTS